MIGQWAHSRWQGEQTFSWSYLNWSLKSHPDLLAVLKSLNAGNAATATAPRASRSPSAVRIRGRAYPCSSRCAN